MTDNKLDLATRHRLPDALRVLLAEFPREAWEEHPEFGRLVRFWLERHLMFRRLTDMLRADAEALIDNNIAGEEYSRRLSRFGSMLIGDLHGHHQIEDTHYFPLLARTEPGIARGFEILDSDHHALYGQIKSFTGTANALLQGLGAPGPAKDEAGRFLTALNGFNRLLDRHLVDEEELIVPVILKHGERSLG